MSAIAGGMADSADAREDFSKLHHNLRNKVGDNSQVSVIVQFKEKPGSDEKNDLKMDGCSVEYVPRHLNLVVAKCSGNNLQRISNKEKVKFVWEDEILYPVLNDSAGQIEADDVWALGYTGSGVNVSVIDTGVNSSHPAFAGKIVLEKDFTTENFTTDVCGHGTAVSSIVVSVNDTFKGIAHGASLFNAKAGQVVSPGQCGFSSYDVINAIDWSVANGAKVISMSIGGPVANCSESIIANYVNESALRDDIPIIVAAGNYGPGSNSISSPGCAENAITIGAVDDNNQIASFSSRGPVVETITRPKPDLVAPGVDIMTANYDLPTFSIRSGTSMATPHVTGVVALMFQVNPYLNMTQVKDVLKNTATNLGYDENTQGAGMVNASKAVNESANQPIPPPIIALLVNDTPDPVIEGQNITYSLFINNTGTGPAFNVTVSETYPAGVIFVSSSPVPSSGNNVFSLGNLNKHGNFTVNVTVNAPAYLFQNGTLLNNSYSITFTHGDGTNSSATANTTTVVETVPDYPGMFLYYSSNSPTDKPKFRNMLENDAFSAENTTVSLGTGADAVWIKSASSPARDEEIIVVQDDLNQVTAQIHTKFGFNNIVNLTTNAGNTSSRRFDIAYDATGRAIIIFTNNSAVPAYQIWNGSSYVGSGALQPSACQGTIVWITAATKQNTSSVATMYADSFGNYCAQIWNGTAWSNVKHFGNDTGVATQKFDIAYEQISGDIVATYESSTTGRIRYCEWNGTWCSTSTQLSDRGMQNDWVKLEAQKSSNRILLGAYQTGDKDIDVIEWNGTAFGTWKQIDSTVENGASVDRIMDITYIGNTGKGLVAYADLDTTVPSYATCANASDCFGGVWSAVAFTTNTSNNCGESSDLDYIGLMPNPFSDKVLLYGISQANHYKCAQFYNGSWGTWTSGLGSGFATSSAEDATAVFGLH